MLSVWNGEQVASVEGAKIYKAADGSTKLTLDLPKKSAEPTSNATISILFGNPNKKQERKKK